MDLVEVEAVSVHDFVPGGNEVADKLGAGVALGVDFSQRTKLRIGAKEEVHARRRPLDIAGGAVAEFKLFFEGRGRFDDVAHVEQVDEEVVGERLGAGGEDAVLGFAVVGVEHAQAADEHSHLGGGEAEELGFVDEELLGGERVAGLRVVTETVGLRLKDGDGGDIGLLGGGVGAAGRERDGDRVAGLVGGVFDGGGAGEDDQVGEGDFLTAGLGGGVEGVLGGFEGFEDLGEAGGLVGFPVFLRGEADARAVGAAAFVGAAEGGGRGPGGGDEFRDGEAGGEDLGLQGGDIGGLDERWVVAGTGSCQRRFSAGTSVPR